MVTEEEIRDALRSVTDPELGQNIVELGMLRGISLSDNQLVVTLALTTPACPLKDQITEDIRSAIKSLDGSLLVDVRLVEMSAEERAKVMGSREAEAMIAQAFNEIGHVIAVMSGKGGVGKSSVAALLAIALRRKGERVGLLDADITGPSIPRMFGLRDVPGSSPLGILPAESKSGIKVMSINLLLPDEDQAVIWRGPLISGAIRQFWGDVFWGTLDTLVIDLPPGTSDATLTVMQSIPLSGVLLVTSPQDLAGMVVRKAAQMAKQLSVPILGLIENMSYLRCPDCGKEIQVFGPSRAEETAKALGVPLVGRIPLDPELAERADGGRVEEYAAEFFAPLAERISQLVPDVKCRPLGQEDD